MGSNPYSHPYAQLLGLLAGAGVGVYGAHKTASGYDDYVKAVNSTLPDNYQVPAAIAKHGFFMSPADIKNRQELITNFSKNAQDYGQGDKVGAFVQQHPELFYGPNRNAGAPATQAQPAPSQALNFTPSSQALPPMLDSNATLGNPKMAQGALDFGNGEPAPQPGGSGMTLQAGTTASPAPWEFPKGLGLSAVKDLLGSTQKGSDIGVAQQNADTTAARIPIEQQNANTQTGTLQLNQKKWQDQEPYRQLQVKKAQTEIQNIQQIMRYRPAEARARIASLSRRTGAQPNAIAMMLASGKTPKQIGEMLYQKGALSAGIDPEGEGNAAVNPGAEADSYLNGN